MSPRSEPALLSLPHIVVVWEWLLEARLWSRPGVDFRAPGQSLSQLCLLWWTV